MTSTSVAQASTDLRAVLDQLTEVESQSLRLSRQNVGRASEVLRLAEETKRERSQPVDDPRTKEELERLERDVKTSRQRWRIMKGTASAVVAGSGVDWASDQELRDIVLDPE